MALGRSIFIARLLLIAIGVELTSPMIIRRSKAVQQAEETAMEKTKAEHPKNQSGSPRTVAQVYRPVWFVLVISWSDGEAAKIMKRRWYSLDAFIWSRQQTIFFGGGPTNSGTVDGSGIVGTRRSKAVWQAEETAAEDPKNQSDSPRTVAQAYLPNCGGASNFGTISASGNIGIRRSKAVRQAEETVAEKTKAEDPKNQSDPSDSPRTVAPAYWPNWPIFSVTVNGGGIVGIRT